MFLISTGEEVYPLRWSAIATKPYTEKHERVIMLSKKIGHKNRIQIVRKDSLTSVKP